MTRNDDKRLDDIVATLAEIAEGVRRGRSAFDQDIALRRALERCLEIVGEASKGLSSDTRTAIPDVPWSQVIRLRDRLSHHYHRIVPGQLWATASTDIPELGSAIERWRRTGETR